jgi:hypothetical protein
MSMVVSVLMIVVVPIVIMCGLAFGDIGRGRIFQGVS